jgi:hypothetical protein
MATSAFNHARGNRPAARQISWVVHIGQVTLEVVGGFGQLGALRGRGLGLLSEAAEVGDELLGVTGEHLPGAGDHPIRPLLIGFAQQAVGDIPHILIGVDEIQNLGESWELGRQA